MDEKIQVISKIHAIKTRLDYVTNLLVCDEYDKAGVQLVTGYMDYHNLIKDFKELKRTILYKGV